MEIIIGCLFAVLIFKLLRTRDQRNKAQRSFYHASQVLDQERQQWSSEREHLTQLIYDGNVQSENLTADLALYKKKAADLDNRLAHLLHELTKDTELKLPDDVKAIKLLVKKMREEGRHGEVQKVMELLREPELVETSGDPWDGPIFE